MNRVFVGCVLAVGFSVALTGCEKSTTAPTTTTVPAGTGTNAPAPAKTHAVNPDAKPETKPEAKPETKPATAPTPAPAVPPAATPKESAPVTKPITPTTPPATPAPANKQVLAGGLIVEDLVVGTGAECKPNASVTIHYRGTLENGEEFDSSIKRGKPATFLLGQLIKGWQVGIPGMKVGGKRKLTIPYPLAYGEAGRPPSIPPKSTLIFEIELLDTK